MRGLVSRQLAAASARSSTPAASPHTTRAFRPEAPEEVDHTPDLLVAKFVLETGHLLGPFPECVKHLVVARAMHPILRLGEIGRASGPGVLRNDRLSLRVVTPDAVPQVDLTPKIGGFAGLRKRIRTGFLG